MNTLLQYNDYISTQIKTFSPANSNAVDAVPSIEELLRKIYSSSELRETGSFFTGKELAMKVTAGFPVAPNDNSIVLDPTCGSGNLLLECSKNFAVFPTLIETLSHWGHRLRGFDIDEYFVEATKLRLILEALKRGTKNNCCINEAKGYLIHIKVLNATDTHYSDFEGVTHLIMNPPFTIWKSPETHYWKKGKINAAGFLFDMFSRLINNGCYVSAILPEVLRSGSRYDEFRSYINKIYDGCCVVWGRFDSKTDVDVFVFSGVKNEREKPEILWFDKGQNIQTLSDYFEVKIGALVAYRDPEEGEQYAYLHPKNSPAWSVISKPNEKRRFKGTVYNPPFVVIKRTSSPSDKYRATATLVTLKEKVAVENHLIVVSPKRKSKIADCKTLLKILKSDDTNSFLNHRIRLRHLTVGAVKEIPFNQKVF